MSEQNCKSRRRYDRQFKEDAVALVRGGRTQSQVARDLGIGAWVLCRWIQKAQAGLAQSDPKTIAAETPERRELRRLRLENEHLLEQRDILKKALGICSAQVPAHVLR
jgi:transposase-like protein